MKYLLWLMIPVLAHSVESFLGWAWMGFWISTWWALVYPRSSRELALQTLLAGGGLAAFGYLQGWMAGSGVGAFVSLWYLWMLAVAGLRRGLGVSMAGLAATALMAAPMVAGPLLTVLPSSWHERAVEWLMLSCPSVALLAASGVSFDWFHAPVMYHWTVLDQDLPAQRWAWWASGLFFAGLGLGGWLLGRLGKPSGTRT